MRRAGGFTLIELVLVMGLLSAFLLMLVQILSSGVGLFRQGESGQFEADRAGSASRTVQRLFDELAGPNHYDWELAPPDVRMVVLEDRLGATGRVPVVRVTVRPQEREVRQHWRRELAARADTAIDAAELGMSLEDYIADLVEDLTRDARAELLMLPWPREKDGALLELRVRKFHGVGPLDPLLGADDEDDAPGFLAPLLAGETFTANWEPADRWVRKNTEVVAAGLLYFDLLLQHPGSADLTRQSEGEVRGDDLGARPLRHWDSARAGLFDGDSGGRARGEFPFDLGVWSEGDGTDDVFPHWLRITMVVSGAGPDTRTSSRVERDSTTVRLVQSDDVPDPDFGPAFVKIGPEWVRVEQRGIRELQVARGKRGTTAREHRAGTPVYVGRQVDLFVRVEHGRDP